jgi:hypothetical protein
MNVTSRKTCGLAAKFRYILYEKIQNVNWYIFDTMRVTFRMRTVRKIFLTERHNN